MYSSQFEQSCKLDLAPIRSKGMPFKFLFPKANFEVQIKSLTVIAPIILCVGTFVTKNENPFENDYMISRHLY